MTTPNGQQANVAEGGSQVGVQAQHAYMGTVTFSGDVQLTVGQDAPAEAKYQVGVENLKSGNPATARRLIWDAMMGNYVNNDVLFHWLVAMLSGRTMQQFSEEEIDQLKRSRSRYVDVGGDAWADGVKLIYRLLDSVFLGPVDTQAERGTNEADMSLLVKRVEKLAETQRNMVRPHLELFLTGPLKDEVWRTELQFAQSKQYDDDRLGRAWMFFQPVPVEVFLPAPRPEHVSTAERVGMQASGWVFAAAVGYLGWELLRHGAYLGLLSCVAALAGGAVATITDRDRRILDNRRLRDNELFRVTNQSAPSPSRDELTDRVDRLFNRYFTKYSQDKAERERWKAEVGGLRKFHRDEIIKMCRRSGIAADEVAWLIRYEVRQLKQRGQHKTLHEYQRQPIPRPSVLAGRTGLAVLVLGGVWALVVLRAHLLADGVALLSGSLAWWCWLRVNLERKRYTTDSEERAQRQAAIDEEFKRWSGKLQVRPKDADMVAWLERDRTVLLGKALDHFQLPRSRLTAHAFLEEPGVAVKRARIEGGLWRYSKYRLLVFLLAETGVRQVRASLDFMTGTLTIRERTSYRYDAIVSMRFLQEPRRQTFELRLTAGEPITVRMRATDLREAQQVQDAGPTEETQEVAEAEEDTAPDVTSLANLMRALEGIAGEGRNWFRGAEWAGAWSAGRGEEEA